MGMACKKIWAALTSVLCVVALTFPTWVTDSVAYAVKAPHTETVAAARDNDALFYEYLLQRAGASDRVSLLSDARSQLSAKDRELYDQLKDFVAEIASGQRTKTVFNIPFPDFPQTWTAQQLGVSAVTKIEHNTILLTDEAEAAIAQKISEFFNFNIDAVCLALLSDCPYELYWYYKDFKDENTNDRALVCQFDYSYTPMINGTLAMDSAPVLTVIMKVSKNYQGGNDTTVNRALHKGIENVVTNAKAIVEAYKSQSDYEKLLGYSTEICNLVTYDYAAADKSNGTSYGDPWQIISVFDGDPETNVVCEGYSKAFKYLCDLTAFDSSNVTCYLVTGQLSSGTGAGDHMWNLVTMGNGKRYMVDVTNSDSNGGPAYLFLKGGTPHSANPAQYTFKRLAFVYDANTIGLWGSEFLTLDTEDYPAPAYPYAYKVKSITPDGSNVTVEIENYSGDGVTLMVAAYAENGQFLRVAVDDTQAANITKETSGSVTVKLDTTDAKTVKAFLLDSATQKPLCASYARTVS